MLSSKHTNSFCLKGSILLCIFHTDAVKELIVDGGRERKSENLSMSPDANLLPVEFLLY